MLKPEQVNSKEFEQSVLGGYKREHVDDFFNEVASDYEKIFNENSELVQKLKVCVSKIEDYQKDEQFLKAAIINAEKLNENSLKNIEQRENEIIGTAQEKAEIILEKAKLEAENIVKTAKLDAAESIKRCEEETAVKIEQLNAQTITEENELIRVKKEVSDFKESVLKLYKVHLNSLSKLPEYKEPVEKYEDSVPVTEKAQLEFQDEQKPEPKASDDVINAPEAEQTEAVPEPEPVKVAAAPSDEKTTEFVIDKKPAPEKPENDEDAFDKNFKFKGLKFGTDFDIKKDN